MKEIKEVIIVEGKSDKQFLETFLKADILTCNGSAIDGFDIEYVKELANKRGVIILTDPDYPGQKIRNWLTSKISVCKQAFVRKENSIKHHKVGVAEASKEEVLLALENVVTFDSNNKGNLKSSDLLKLNIIGLNSKTNKQKIIDHFHIGYCNSKTLLNRLNLLNVSLLELESVINDK